MNHAKRIDEIISLFNMDTPLLFSFKDNLSGIDYYLLEDGSERLFLSSPLLVRDRKLLQNSSDWECNKHKFFSGLFFVKLRECVYLCSQNVWSPSVDAVVLLETIKENQKLFCQCTSIFDFGCGTGVAGIGLASILPAVERIYLYDTNPFASIFSSINLYINNITKDTTILNNSSIHSIYSDLCITTPYYIPVEKSIISSPKEDIQTAVDNTVNMINFTVNNSKKFALFVYSSITGCEVCCRIPKHEILYEHEVLFTIGDNVGNNEIVNYLINNNKLKYINGDYYHKIYIGLVRNG